MAQILAPTLLLNEQTLSANATIPTIPAGNGNRFVILTFFTYTGSGTSNPPTAISCNGQAGTYLTGDSGSTKTTLASYYFTESQIASIQGQSLVSTTGAAGSSKSLVIHAYDNCAQTLTANKLAVHTESSTAILQALTRSNNSMTIAFGASSTSTAVLTFGNPSTISSIALTSTRRITYGITSDTSGTVNFSSNGSNSTSVHAFNIQPFPAGTITDLNGGASVKAGSTGNSVTPSGFSPTGGTGGGKTLTAWSGSNPYTFTQPAYVDGATYPEPDTSQAFVFTDGDQSPQVTRILASPNGMASVVIASPVTDDNTYPGYWLNEAGVPPANNDRFVYPTESGNFSIGADGKITAATAGTRVIYIWRTATQIMTTINLTVSVVTPTAFSFGSVTDAPISTFTVANTQVTVAGVPLATDYPVVATGGLSYRVSTNNGVSFGAWTSATTNVQLGYVIEAALTSSALNSTLLSGSLTIGDTTGTFNLTTIHGDNLPNPFIFTTKDKADPSTQYISNTVTVSGMDTVESSPITIVNGEYSKNSGAYVSTPGTVVNGDTIKIRATSDPFYSRTKTITVTATGTILSTYLIINKADSLIPSTGGIFKIGGSKLTGRKL
jgi:hypothetical protein